MTQIFRIKSNNQGTNSPFNDWSSTSQTPYGKGIVDNIDETTAKRNEITSIPSPFARIELVKNAFSKIIPGSLNNYTAEQVKTFLHGTSIYNKTVSDTLDVAQIFYMYPSMKDKVQILIWDRFNDLQALSDSDDGQHQLVGKTLEMFLQQDGTAVRDPYNFTKLQKIYILRYIGPNSRGIQHIIGATSPATLFFSTANDNNDISKHLCFGTDYAFDGEYASLDQRDPAFIEYLFILKYSNKDFDKLYPEVSEYLEAVYMVLPNTLKTTIQGIQTACTNFNGQGSYVDTQYQKLDFKLNGIQQNTVEVNGMQLHCKTVQVQGNSDFEIKPTTNIVTRPLVLPVNGGNVYSKWTYYGSAFGDQHRVPYYDAQPLNQRNLPGIGVQYPYLTISDFLDDKIIQLPGAVNSSDFFDGNINTTDSSKGFLLPIMPAYFDYFTLKDLMGTTPSGKKTIEITPVAGNGVSVTLRIPVKNGEIEYDRIYNVSAKADKATNKGGIVMCNPSTTVGVMPPVKFANAAEAHYRIVVMSPFNINKDCSCEFYDSGNGIFQSDYVVRNVTDQNDIRSKVYFLENKEFDAIRVTIATDVKVSAEKVATGLLIPIFKQPTNNNTAFSFAIDLGTSNTHIEYRDSPNSMPRAFDYANTEPQISLVCGTVDDILRQHISAEFLPEAVGNNSPCHFPMRTVLSEDKTNSGWNEKTGTGSYIALGNSSVAFMYNKSDTGDKYNEYKTDIKWSTDANAEEDIRCYIESLMMMIRAKVINSGGSISQTKIRWFYPVSMSTFKQNLFAQVWQDAYNKYFNGGTGLDSITESIAPYSYFQQTMPSVTNIVTIDIGGGTTDIVVADNNGVQLITSMRFAADAIFGNPLVNVTKGAPLNGLIKYFIPSFATKLRSLSRTSKMFTDKTLNNGNSSEVASFLFSLVENEEVKASGITGVDFNAELAKNTHFKIIFFIFYTAIIYHLAQLIKAKDLTPPANIAFSGNGSKIVSVLGNAKSLQLLNQTIFRLVYEADVAINYISAGKEPKEATCKGGLMIGNPPANVDGLKTVLLGTDKQVIVDTQKYGGVEQFYPSVIQEVFDFLDFFTLRIPRSGISLKNLFGIDDQSIALTKSVFGNSSNLKGYLDTGIGQKLNSGDVTKNDTIEESLFFYPVMGILNDLSEQIYANSQPNQPINNN